MNVLVARIIEDNRVHMSVDDFPDQPSKIRVEGRTLDDVTNAVNQLQLYIQRLVSQSGAHSNSNYVHCTCTCYVLYILYKPRCLSTSQNVQFGKNLLYVTR